MQVKLVQLYIFIVIIFCILIICESSLSNNQSYRDISFNSSASRNYTIKSIAKNLVKDKHAESTTKTFKLKSDSNSDINSCTAEESSEVESWILNGGIIVVLLGIFECFWGLARVCDHYFCSSLLILCEESHIPDDVENLINITTLYFR